LGTNVARPLVVSAVSFQGPSTIDQIELVA
jgi:hypothetical protein